MQAVILTGIVAGFVHVVSGADHLIAMTPAAINNPKEKERPPATAINLLINF